MSVHRIGFVTVLALVGALSAGCDSGDDDNPPPPPQPVPPSAQQLVANAGDDQEIPVTGTAKVVTLDARKSFFRPTDTTTRAPSATAWVLVSGPGSVTGPSPTNAALASVTFPANAVAGTYTFRATVTEAGTTNTDEMNVIVKRFVISSIADQIHLGFTLPGGSTLTTSITANLAGTVSGTPTFTWTGWEPEPFFRSVTGASTKTITFGAPELGDVQKLSEVPGILGLWFHGGGYHRFTVTATDQAGGTDSEDVLVSFGVSTSGLNNVPLQVPVYLNGGSSVTDTWAWTVSSKPSGSTLDDTKLRQIDGTTLNAATDQQVIWFVPDVQGLYFLVGTHDVIVNSVTTTAVTVFEVNAAAYVSIGTIASVAPNPDLGQCAGCHGGSVSFLEDITTPWLGTLHASRGETLFDPTNQTLQARINLRDLSPEALRATTGFYLADSPTFTAATAGFDDIAITSQAVPFRGLDFATLTTRYPESARMTQVQCEACHGPGSLHVGDSQGIALSIKVDVCARCHDHEPAGWANSKHSEVVTDAGSGSCMRCHTAQAAIDPRALAFRYPAAPPSLPIPSAEGRENTATCAVCHDPHDASRPFQLRITGDIPLPGGVAVVPAGNAAMCFHCHNARRDPTAARSGRNDPHPGAQGDMLAGKNGREFPGYSYASSPHASPEQVFQRKGVTWNWCIECHMAANPPLGDPKHDHLGGHSFAVTSELGVNESFACAKCHPISTFTLFGRDFYASTARADYDDDGGVPERVQDEIAGLLQYLGGAETADAANPFGIAHAPGEHGSGGLLLEMAQTITTSAGIITSHGAVRIVTSFGPPEVEINIPAGADGDLLWGAAWNYYLVIEEKSMGLHNTGYAVSILQASIKELEKRLGRSGTFQGDPFVPF